MRGKMKLLFLDTETTGLDVRRHEVWEVGAIIRDYHEDGTPYSDIELHWFLPVNLDKADLIALNIGRYFERHPWGKFEKQKTSMDVANETVFAREFMQFSMGAHIVGAVPNFDTEFLAPILYRNNCIPAWHYHLVCCENLAAGYLKMEPPWKSDEIFGKLGIDKEKYERHTALGDARMVRDVYDIVMGRKDEEVSSSSDDEPTAIDTGF